MNKKSEKKQDAENSTCINLDNLKKFGRVIPKPKQFLEIGKSHAINNLTGLRVDLVYGISVQAEPLVICNDKAFRLRWVDVLALALKQSTLIQESVSMPEDEELEEFYAENSPENLSGGRRRKPTQNDIDAEGCPVNEVGEENSDMGGE